MAESPDTPPPWLVFPQMPATELGATQGAQEAWLDGIWRPFWASLSAAEREHYLQRWQASPAWREAIRAVCEQVPGFDAAEDARDSATWLAAQASTARRGWVQRLTRWLRKG